MAFDKKQEQYETDLGFSEATSAYEAPYVICHTGSEDTMEQKQEFKAVLLKPLLEVGFGILLAVLSWLLFTKTSTDADYHYIGADAIEVFTDTKESNTYVFTGSGDMLYKIPEEFIVNYTSDHTSAILYNTISGKCHVVNNKEDYEIFSPVLSIALSDDGNYVLYSVSGGMGKYFLYLYDMEKHSETLLDSREYRLYGNMYVSAGGRLCFFTTYPMNLDETAEGISSYLIKDRGKPELLGKNLVLTAYSGEQQVLYLCGIQEDGTAIYSKSINGITTVLSKNITHAVYYNEDYSELLLDENGKYLLWTDTGVNIPISDTLITGVLIPSKVQFMSPYGSLAAYGFDSFRNKLLITKDNRLLFLDSNYQSRVLATEINPQNTVLSRDGRTLLYCNQAKQLIKITDFEGNCEQTILEEQVDAFRPLSDFTRIYYLMGSKLYYKSKNREAVLISEQASNLCRNQAGDTIFFLKDMGNEKAVYSSTDGKKPEPVMVGEQVTGLKEWNFGVVVQCVSDHETKAYYNLSGSEFTYLIDGVDMISQEDTSHKLRLY